MNVAQQRFQAARTSYSSIDLSSRIEGASPHQLVMILFDELLKSLEAMKAAAAKGDRGHLAASLSRAQSMLYGLESSLDMEKGGEIARNLAAVYAETKRLAVTAARDCNAASAESARAMIGEIASAWAAVG